MYIILLAVILTIFLIFILSLGKSPYIRSPGIPTSQLAQPHSFYKKHRQGTLTYLQAIYPTAKQDLEKLSDLDLASFYNSLWFYFNCRGRYTDNDLGSLTGKNDDTKWDPLPCANQFPLPYTPQGWLYNFYTYQKYNIPEIYSNSDSSVVYLQVENASSNRAGIMGTYISPSIRSSGIMWVMQRSIQRDIWYPNGIFNNKPIQPNYPDNWQIIVGKKPEYNFPNGWYGKLGDNQYIEITHSPSNTGDALNMSPFWWYNVSVGSGLFLNLGKTLAVKNKVAGIFEQAKLLANTPNGRNLLTSWYNTTDPYTITFGIIGLCGYNSETGQRYCDFSKQACGIACEPNPIGYAKASNTTISNFYTETIKAQQTMLGIPEFVPTQEGIKLAIDLARDNKNYFLAHVAEQLLCDETNFFFGVNLGFDTIQFYEDPNGNDNYVFELIDLRIPQQYLSGARNREYSGFMNIVDPNAVQWSTSAVGNSYKDSVIAEYLQNAYNNNWLSIRSPFDVYNEKKVLKCSGTVLSRVCGGGYAKSMYCDELPLLSAYKCLSLGNEFVNDSCVLTGANPTC
jgi:hypothetical protein